MYTKNVISVYLKFTSLVSSISLGTLSEVGIRTLVPCNSLVCVTGSQEQEVLLRKKRNWAAVGGGGAAHVLFKRLSEFVLVTMDARGLAVRSRGGR